MKYIAVVLLIAFMAWTWSLSLSKSALNLKSQGNQESDKARLEKTFSNYIKELIRAKNPEIYNVVFNEITTEVIKPDEEIKVNFSYRYDVPAGGDVAEQTEQGSVVLTSTDGGKTWSGGGSEMSAPVLRFGKGTTIRPDGAGEE